MQRIGPYFMAFMLLLLALPSLVNATPSCTNDWVGGACLGDITYTTNTILTNTINTDGNVIINSGIGLTTNGFAIISGQTINGLLGTIIAGQDIASSCTGSVGTNGNSILTSYGGSGGGGAGHTTSGGNGNTPSAPTLSNSLIQTFNSNGLQNYLEGGGGACSGDNKFVGAGDGGNTIAVGGIGDHTFGGIVAIGEAFGSAASKGIYIQANKVILGQINAYGANGINNGANPSFGGAGGGGGVIIIAYNSQYVPGTYNTLGGAIGTGVNGNGGAGGNGQVATFNWIFPPISVASPQSAGITITPNPVTYGTNSVITATCETGDTCRVDSPLGTPLCSGTTTCAFTANYIVYGVGTYTFWPNDITLGTNGISNTLTINAAPMISTLSNCGSQAYTLSGYSCVTTATFPSIFDQVQGNVFLQGVLVGNTIIGSTNSFSYTIQNVIGQQFLLANSPSTANYLSNSLSVNWLAYVPISVQNATNTLILIPTNGAQTSASNTVTGWHNPFKIFTQSPSNTISYILQNSFASNSFGNTIPNQYNVANVSYYSDSANIITGTWRFLISESQYGNTIYANQLFNPLTQNVAFGTSTNGIYTCIQYFSCFVDNGLSFYSSPTSYKIDGATNTITGTTVVKGTNTLVLPLNIQLIYNQFTPSLSFNLTYSLGQTVNTINAIAFNVLASNAVPPAVNSRRIFNITTQDEATSKLMNASTAFSWTALINNWTVSNSITYTGWNSVGIFVSNTNYINPPISFSSIFSSSRNGSYFPAQNNYCGRVENSTTAANLFIYLVSFAVGQSTTINLLSNSAGANNNDFLQILHGVNPLFSTVVQQVLISTQSFTVPLIVGDSYSFTVLTPGCSQIYQTPATTQSNPIYINIPTNLNVSVISLPNSTATCTLAFNSTFSSNTVTCIGRDTVNRIAKWNVTLYNSSGFAGFHTIVSNSFNGGSFRWQYYPVPYPNPVYWKVTGSWGGTNDPSQSWLGSLQNLIVSSYNTPLNTLIVVIFLLMGIAAGARLEGQHKLSTTLFIEALILVFLYFVGLTAWLGYLFNGGVIAFLIIVGIFGYSKESSGVGVIGG